MPAVALKDISKRFGPVQANRDITFDIPKGSITGIVGENGAGKSTLMSILYGFYTADTGHIELDGQPVKITNSADAIGYGIGMVHQHFMLVPTFSVLENVMLGAEGNALLAQGKALARQKLAQLGTDFGLTIDPDALIADLPVGLQQRVEILKALSRGARVLILDEPTGVLTPQEADSLFEILGTLSASGVTILLITHKLREIFAITDQVVVMRGGAVVATKATRETDQEELARLMVGRDVQTTTARDAPSLGETVLSVSGLGKTDDQGTARLKDISFELRAGEILGVAGVSGNGQSELLDALSGIDPIQTGSMTVLGRTISADQPSAPAEMRHLGVAHVPEDRHQRGLVLPFSAAESSILGYQDWPQACDGLWINHERVRSACDGLMERFDVRPPLAEARTGGFSGGNQQKIVLGRELGVTPKVLFVGQPTRGVDIGAIEFIHAQLVAMAEAGSAILLVSVELDEILALSDRILVMNEGRIVGTLDRAEATPEKIGAMMAGVGPDSASENGKAGEGSP